MNGTEIGFCPRCQATRNVRSSEHVVSQKTGERIRRRELSCMTCTTTLSMSETPIKLEVIPGKP